MPVTNRPVRWSLSNVHVMPCWVIFVAACVLRVKEPDMERPFRVPLGNKGFIAMCIPPVLIAVTALYLSGADYFLAGMVALSSGPIAYFFIKRKYGGMAKIFPGEFPLNPTTGMGLGDTRRAALLLSIMALACLAAVFFLPGNEDPQAYVDSYGIEGMFDKLMIGIRWLTGIFGVAAIALWVIARRVEPVSPNTAQEPRP